MTPLLFAQIAFPLLVLFVIGTLLSDEFYTRPWGDIGDFLAACSIVGGLLLIVFFAVTNLYG